MTLEYKPNLNEAVRRMERFWALEPPEDRVPVLIHLANGVRGGLDGYYFGRTKVYADNAEEHFKRRAEITDEFIPQFFPQYGHVIFAALCGAEIKHAAQTLWAMPLINDLQAAAELRLDWNNDWGKRFIEDYAYLTERARSKCYVSEYGLEGVSDTLSAFRGAEQVFFDFADDPIAAHALAVRVTDLLIEFGKWNNAHISGRPGAPEGMSSDWAFWMPCGSCCTAEDFAAMCGADFYRAHIKEHAQRLASSFTQTVFEVHKEMNHLIGDFGDTNGISLMTIENFFGMDARHRVELKRLAGKRCFYIGAQPDRIEDVLSFMGTKGVLIVTHARSTDEAKIILDNAERVTQRLTR